MEENKSPKTNLQDEINKQIGNIGGERPGQTPETNSIPEKKEEVPIPQNVSPAPPAPPVVTPQNIVEEKPTPQETEKVVSDNLIQPDIQVQKEGTSIPQSVNSVPPVITPKPPVVNARPPIIPQHPEPPVIKPLQTEGAQQEVMQPNIQEQPSPSAEQIQQPPAKEVTPADEYQISTVRTYKADLNQTVQSDKITTAKVLMAEQKKREKQEKVQSKNSIENPKNKFKLFFSVVLIGLAIVAVLYGTFLFFAPEPEINPNNILNPESGLIAIDENQYVDITNRLRGDILAEVETFKNFGHPERTIKELILFRKEKLGEEEISKKLPIESLFILFEFNPPFVFTRTLTDDYILGSYRLNSENKKFLLIKLEDFENAYDSLFDYEDDLVRDMSNILGGFSEFDQIDQLRERKNELQRAAEEAAMKDEGAADGEEVSVEEPPAEEVTAETDSTANASTTEEVEEPKDPIEVIDEEIARIQTRIDNYQNFIDIVLQNSDSRAILGENSEVLFYYTFIDREWVLFADDTEVLREIKRRIREQNLVR